MPVEGRASRRSPTGGRALSKSSELRKGIKRVVLAKGRRLARLVRPSALSSSNVELAQRIVTELRELVRWVDVPLPHFPDGERIKRIEKAAGLLRESGVSEITVAGAVQQWQKRPRGRPMERSYLALCALEMKMATPTLTYARIAKKLKTASADDLRRNVRRLKAILRRHGIMPENL